MAKAKKQDSGKQLSRKELEDLVIESEAGARRPSSNAVGITLFSIALLWSLFQLWIASPLPFSLGILVFNDTHTRSIHLGFAILLAYLFYPATKKSPRTYIPIQDWIMAIAAAFSASYLFIFYEELANRSGLPTNMDIGVACAGMLLLLEAARRSLGLPIVIIAALFLTYTFAGSLDVVPDVIKHKGQALSKVASHQWLTTEGVFGIALGVSSGFVFLFVLFGALLDRAGAGNYFIKLAFSLLGHFRGGPAKAAVASSAMMGLVSGSSIASTVTIGTFTIPLMRKVGFSGTKAGAIEVASAVNAQIMPPVMGAAAFLIAEYVGIPYVEVIKHAFLPAVISYIALFYIVHLEAVKLDLHALDKPHQRTFLQSMFVWATMIVSTIIFSAVVYFSVSWMKVAFGEYASYVFAVLLLLAYLALLWYSSQFPELEEDDPNSPIIELAETGPTFKAGLHYLLPIVVLVWCLMVERLSPGFAAFWATLLMIFILTTQHFFKALFHKTGELSKNLKRGFEDLLEGLIMGARNMIGVGIATAAAGVIVGTVSLTGVGQVLTEVVEIIAGDSIFLILLLTAIISLILGMGLPTTANYIVVASLMSHVVVELGAQNGLIVPLVAVHLFVFYFGIMADVTPPVGLASFAAAAISGADPIKTGVQGFTYAVRTAILPFFFIFDTEIIMIGVDSIWYGAWVAIKATVALMLFSAAMQGYFIVRSKWYESILLFIVTFTFFAPQFWINRIVPPYVAGDLMKIEQVVESLEKDDLLKIHVKGENERGVLREFKSFIPVTSKSSDKTFEDFGIIVSKNNGTLIVDDVIFNSKAEKSGLDFDYEITNIEVPQDQPNKSWMYIPTVFLLGIVVMLQTVRRRKQRAINKLA